MCWMNDQGGRRCIFVRHTRTILDRDSESLSSKPILPPAVVWSWVWVSPYVPWSLWGEELQDSSKFQHSMPLRRLCHPVTIRSLLSHQVAGSHHDKCNSVYFEICSCIGCRPWLTKPREFSLPLGLSLIARDLQHPWHRSTCTHTFIHIHVCTHTCNLHTHTLTPLCTHSCTLAHMHTPHNIGEHSHIYVLIDS